jgi:hypothetical protein
MIELPHQPMQPSCAADSRQEGIPAIDFEPVSKPALTTGEDEFSWRIFSRISTVNSNLKLGMRIWDAKLVNQAMFAGIQSFYHRPELPFLVDSVHAQLFAGAIQDREKLLRELTQYLVDHADQYLIGIPQSVIEDLKSLKAAVHASLEHLDHALFFDLKPGVVSALCNLGKYTVLLGEGKTSVSLALTLIAVETSASAASGALGGKAGLAAVGWLAKTIGFAINPVVTVVFAGATALVLRRITKAAIKTGKKLLSGYNDLAKELEYIQNTEDTAIAGVQESQVALLATQHLAVEAAFKEEFQQIQSDADESWNIIAHRHASARCEFYYDACAGLEQVNPCRKSERILSTDRLRLRLWHPVGNRVAKIAFWLRDRRQKKEMLIERQKLLVENDLDRGLRRLNNLLSARPIESPRLNYAFTRLAESHEEASNDATALADKTGLLVHDCKVRYQSQLAEYAHKAHGQLARCLQDSLRRIQLAKEKLDNKKDELGL